MEARPGPSTMGLSHQGRLVGRRARPSGVNIEEHHQVQKELKTVQPLGAWQGLREPGAAKGQPCSPHQQAGLGGSSVWGINGRAQRTIWTWTALGWTQDGLGQFQAGSGL